MIILTAGLVAILVLTVITRLIEIVHAPRRRRIATERRERWEAAHSDDLRPALHGAGT